jgi:hypothetical protein
MKYSRHAVHRSWWRMAPWRDGDALQQRAVGLVAAWRGRTRSFTSASYQAAADGDHRLRDRTRGSCSWPPSRGPNDKILGSHGPSSASASTSACDRMVSGGIRVRTRDFTQVVGEETWIPARTLWGKGAGHGTPRTRSADATAPSRRARHERILAPMIKRTVQYEMVRNRAGPRRRGCPWRRARGRGRSRSLGWSAIRVLWIARQARSARFASTIWSRHASTRRRSPETAPAYSTVPTAWGRPRLSTLAMSVVSEQ